jgi:hypothetical protein
LVAIKAETVEALMPFARASLANSLFQALKPADELPHWAASAGEITQVSMAKVRKVAVVSPLLSVIGKFLGWLKFLLKGAALAPVEIQDRRDGHNNSVPLSFLE